MIKTVTRPLFLSAALLLLSCAGIDAPPAPNVELQGFSPAIRTQIEAAQARYSARPDDADANGQLAMLLDAYRKTETAAAYYARARHFAPDRFRWSYLHARALLALGKTEEAVAALRTALSQRPDYPPAQLTLAEQLVKLGANDEAREIYTRLIERNPNLAQAHHGYARMLLEAGDTRMALVALHTALALSPRYGEAHYTLAELYRDTGEAALADTHLALFERYRLFRPPSDDGVVDAIERLDQSEQRRPRRGLEALSRGRFDEAIAEFQALADAKPDHASPHINLIAAYAETGQFDKAQHHAAIATRLDPDAVELHDNVGIMRMRQGRIGEAIDAFRRAVEADPDYSVPYRNLGAVLELDGRQSEAIDAYRKSIEIEPTARQARYLLGQLLLRNGQPAEALEVLEPLQRVELADTPLHLLALGKAQLAVDRPAAAVSTLARAHALAQVQGLEGVGIEMGRLLERARRAERD